MPDPIRPRVVPEFEPYIMAVGMIAANWSYLEHSMNDVIWEFCNVSKQAGACITSQIVGPGPRIRCLAALMNFRSVPKELIKEYNSLGAEIEAAGRQRNRYLHDMIVSDDDPSEISRIEITADRVLKFEATLLVLDKMHNLSDELVRLDSRFNDLAGRAVAAAPPWPRTQFRRSPGIHELRTKKDSAP